eukprot:4276478-Pyramimonas_sp.AAC.1
MVKTDSVVCTTVPATSVIIYAGIPGMVLCRDNEVHGHCGVPHLVVYTGAAVYTSAAVHTFAMVYTGVVGSKDGAVPCARKINHHT